MSGGSGRTCRWWRGSSRGRLAGCGDLSGSGSGLAGLGHVPGRVGGVVGASGFAWPSMDQADKTGRPLDGP